MGSSVYFILFFINLFPLSPVSGSEKSDHIVPIREPYRQDSFSNDPKAIESLFLGAVFSVNQNYAFRISKRILRKNKWDPVLFLVLPVFGRIPFK